MDPETEEKIPQKSYSQEEQNQKVQQETKSYIDQSDQDEKNAKGAPRSLLKNEKSGDEDWSVQSNKKDKQEENINEQKSNGRKNNRAREEQQQWKQQPYIHYVDDKIYTAIKKLFSQEVKELASKRKMKISIHRAKACLIIFYHQQHQLETFLEELFDFIENIEILEIPVKVVSSGFHLSSKYQQSLKKEKMFVFEKEIQFGKEKKCYICGNVSKQALNKKITQIRQVNFSWMKLYSFPDTRSYRRIFQEIFERPDFKESMYTKFKAQNFQVAHKNRQLYQSQNDELILLMTLEEKAKSISLKIDESIITDFIKTTYLICCFILEYKSTQAKRHKYSSKAISQKGITMFFIHEKKSKDSYLFIIALRQNFRDLKLLLEKQIEDMNLPIIGRRYFRNLRPDLSKQDKVPSEYKVFKIPPNKNYSRGVISFKSPFDWKKELRCIG